MKTGDLIQFGNFEKRMRSSLREGIILELSETPAGPWTQIITVLTGGRHIELRIHKCHPHRYVMVDEDPGGRASVEIKVIGHTV